PNTLTPAFGDDTPTPALGSTRRDRDHPSGLLRVSGGNSRFRIWPLRYLRFRLPQERSLAKSQVHRCWHGQAFANNRQNSGPPIQPACYPRGDNQSGHWLVSASSSATPSTRRAVLVPIRPYRESASCRSQVKIPACWFRSRTQRSIGKSK